MVLADFAGDPSVIALTMPVDYWDYLGWKDTLADHLYTARQKAYALIRGDGAVYTPQVVVNGSQEVIGSDSGSIESAIKATARDPSVMSVPINLDVDRERIRVDIRGEHSIAKAGEVWVFAVSRKVPVAIKHGENRGKAITYTNVVRSWMKVGNWSGGNATYDIHLVNITGDDINAAVVYLQEGSRNIPGPMLGAKLTPLDAVGFPHRAELKAINSRPAEMR